MQRGVGLFDQFSWRKFSQLLLPFVNMRDVDCLVLSGTLLSNLQERPPTITGGLDSRYSAKSLHITAVYPSQEALQPLREAMVRNAIPAMQEARAEHTGSAFDLEIRCHKISIETIRRQYSFNREVMRLAMTHAAGVSATTIATMRRVADTKEVAALDEVLALGTDATITVSTIDTPGMRLITREDYNVDNAVGNYLIQPETIERIILGRDV